MPFPITFFHDVICPLLIVSEWRGSSETEFSANDFNFRISIFNPEIGRTPITQFDNINTGFCGFLMKTKGILMT